MLSQILRPKTFDEMAGQKENIKILKAIINNPNEAPKTLIFSGAFGSGKCVTGNTRVHTSEGYKRIDSICDISDVGEDGFLDIEKRQLKVDKYHNASDFYYGGVKDTIKIHSQKFDIEGTPNHRIKVYTDNGVKWVRLDEVECGDWVCMAKKREDVLFNKVVGNMNQGILGYLCGAICSGGYINRYNEVMLIVSDAVYGFLIGVVENAISYVEIHPTYKRKIITINNDMGYERILKELAKCEGNIPEWVFETNEKFIGGFISGYMDHHVCIDVDDIGEDKTHIKNFDIDNAIKIRDLFNILGMYPRLFSKTNVKGTKKKYNIVMDHCDIDEFRSNTFMKNKYTYKSGVGMVFNSNDIRWRCNSNIEIPYNKYTSDCVSKVVEELEIRGYDVSKDSLCSKLRRCEDKNFGIDEKSYKRLKYLLGMDDIHTGLDDIIDVYKFCKVESKCCNRKEVYDLTVPVSHCFMANGVINHNTTSARIMARELNNIKDDNYDLFSSPFYYEFDSTVVGNVEDIKKIKETLTVPVGEYWKVVVLDECHSISNAAQTALLKIFEEVADKTIYILATTHPQKLIPTIRSRSMELNFDVISYEDVKENIIKMSKLNNIDIDEEAIDIISRRSGGHMRNAHMLLDKYVLLGNKDFKDTIHDATNMYCKMFRLAFHGKMDEASVCLNELSNIPKDTLESDFNNLRSDCLRYHCGMSINNKAVEDLMKDIKPIFGNLVSAGFMSTWAVYTFVDMPFFQASMLNMLSIIKKSSEDLKLKQTAPTINPNGPKYGGSIR